MRSFDSVLVANRGEIAVRIISACRAEKLRAIAVYSDADASAMHVRRADEAHRIGPPPPAESYLNIEAILEAADKRGAQAVHPGYGFLSENADFAERCQQAGLVWIGPPPSAMRLLGDKAAAKALAERIGVPVLPGYHGEAQDDESLRAAAELVGYPLLVKAAAGGGGRGMRLVRTPDDLDEALASARREAQAGFGDSRLLLERYLERPRHVEMQILADEHGNHVYLGERDCSVQRRHQKVIEEAPAPNFSVDQRSRMGEASIALTRAAGYSNAGTVEYLLDQDGSFYFLEVNTRLQVEHPVTEMVTGLDLVGLQFKVAAGEPLPIRQEDVQIRGHAVECRLYAEDPWNGFLPTTGRLDRVMLLQASHREFATRVDAGVETGDVVSPYYDPLLAKVIAHGPDRDATINWLASMVAQSRLQPLRTNLRFLVAILTSDAFAEGRLSTSLVDDEGLSGGPLPPTEMLIAAAAGQVLFPSSHRTPDPDEPVGWLWRLGGPWRMGWVGVELRYLFDGQLISVRVQPGLEPDEAWVFHLFGRTFEWRIRRAGDGPEAAKGVMLETDRGTRNVSVGVTADDVWVRSGRRSINLELASGLDTTGQSGPFAGQSTHDVVRAPMPGRIVKLLARPGDRVKANQTLLVLEAMKIEHLVSAPRDGVIEAVRYTEGDQVELGAELVELED